LPRERELYPLGEEFMRGFRMGLKGPLNIFTWREEDIFKLSQLRRAPTALILAVLTSKDCWKLAKILKIKEIPVLLPVSEDLRLFEIDNFFPFYGLYYLETIKIADFFSSLGTRRFVIFYPKSPLGKSVASVFEETVKRRRGKILMSLPFLTSSTNFEEMLNPLKDIEFDAVFIPYGRFGSLVIASTLRYMGIETPILGLDDWTSSEALKWSEGGMEGVYIASLPPNPKEAFREKEEIRSFREAYKTLYEIPPSLFALRGYDAGRIVTLLFEKGPLFPLEAREKLKDLGPYYGVSGRVLFSKETKFIRIYQLRGGKLIEERLENEEK